MGLDYPLNKNLGFMQYKPAIEIYATKDIEAGQEVCLHYMHHSFDLEISPNGEWWNASESDMTSALGGYDDSVSALMSDTKKNYR